MKNDMLELRMFLHCDGDLSGLPDGIPVVMFS